MSPDPPPAGGPAVSVVVVSFNAREHLLRCLVSLERHVALPLEVLVVDNASADGSAQAARAGFPAARVLENPVNEGFARASNRGLRESRAPFVLLLNPDAEVRPGAVEAMAGILAARARIAAVGPRTLSEDGTIQVSFGPALTPLREWRQRRLVRAVKRREPWALREAGAAASREHQPFWVSGSCLMARRSALEAVGLLDEGYFLYEEDVDLCLRLRRAGFEVLFTPAAEVVHRLGRSMEQAAALAWIEYHRSHLRYYRKHNGPLLSAALRVHLGLRAALRLLRPPGAAGGAAQRRADAAALLRLAVLGR